MTIEAVRYSQGYLNALDRIDQEIDMLAKEEQRTILKMSSNYMLPSREDFIKAVEEVTKREDFSKASGLESLGCYAGLREDHQRWHRSPDEYVQREEMASPVGYVVALGDPATPIRRGSNGPYCKEGDFIIMRPFSGTRGAP